MPRPFHESVKPYHRHVLACTGRTDWIPKLREGSGFLARMARETRALRAQAVVPRFGAIDRPTAGDGGDETYDLRVWPEGVAYPGVTEASWDTIRRVHLEEGRVATDLPHEPIEGVHVLVCTHGRRDPRCGDCGPPVVEALREEVDRHDLDRVHVHATSHVGGHKYAGNVVCYPSGDWYGRVGPRDAAEIIEAHRDPDDPEVVERLHRGRMSPLPG